MSLRVALIHDWLITLGGGERVFEALVRLFPEADVFTLLHDPRAFADTALDRSIYSSVLQYLPFSTRYHRPLVAIMPWALRRIDLRAYDLIISSSSAVAHGVRTHSGQLHVNYIHSPMRYAWEIEESLELWGWARGWRGLFARKILAGLREWDRAAALRVDFFIANSRYTAKNVRRFYNRAAEVIYPPVRTQLFAPAEKREDYYVTLARLVPHKRIDLIIGAFNVLGKPLIILGDGPELARLQARAMNNVSFVTDASDEKVATLLGSARAFVFAGVEEFGIAVVEAQAAGCPVIAYGRAGVLETVLPGVTGIFYDEQSVQGIIGAVEAFEENSQQFRGQDIRRQAEEFSEQIFDKAIIESLNRFFS